MSPNNDRTSTEEEDFQRLVEKVMNPPMGLPPNWMNIPPPWYALERKAVAPPPNLVSPPGCASRPAIAAPPALSAVITVPPPPLGVAVPLACGPPVLVPLKIMIPPPGFEDKGPVTILAYGSPPRAVPGNSNGVSPSTPPEKHNKEPNFTVRNGLFIFNEELHDKMGRPFEE